MNFEKPYAPVKSIIFTALFTCSLWFLSCTILLPFFLALVISSWLRAKFFGLLYSLLIVNLFPQLLYMQKKLFDEINEEYVAKNPKKTFRFLEIGVGSGVNFSLYPENCTLTLLDMNPNFDVYIKERLKNFPHLKIEKIVFAPAEDMKDVLNDDYDVVVATHLMCSVSDVQAVFSEIRRVLKPGGKFIFMDHIAYRANPFVYGIQLCLTPLWKVYCNGCCLSRDIPSIIPKFFRKVSCRITYPSFMPLILRAHVTGIAEK